MNITIFPQNTIILPMIAISKVEMQIGNRQYHKTPIFYNKYLWILLKIKFPDFLHFPISFLCMAPDSWCFVKNHLIKNLDVLWFSVISQQWFISIPRDSTFFNGQGSCVECSFVTNQNDCNSNKGCIWSSILSACNQLYTTISKNSGRNWISLFQIMVMVMVLGMIVML